jgi:hypothetical protein
MSVRWNQLNLLAKEELIGVYLRGVRQPDERLISSAGPASELRKWKRVELINSLLDIGWPGVAAEVQ